MTNQRRKKKILYISQAFPFPADSGGKIKTFYTLRTLARKYIVYALFVSDRIPAANEVRAVTRLGVAVTITYSPGILYSVKNNLLGLARHYLRGIPQYVFQYTDASAFYQANRLVHELKPDVIHIDHLNMSQYLPEEKKQRWILEHHNVETYLYWTRFVHTGKITRKLYLFMEMLLTYVYEFRTLRRFDHVFTISKPEEERAKRMFFVHNVSTQPLVYPGLHLTKRRHKGKRILFIGTLGWPPNEDAIEWFVHKIFPLIRRIVPNAEFHVVGRPGPRYAPPGSDHIILHGFQINLDSYLSTADVFVLPFHMGGGLRLKALMALSVGLPVVTTALGVDGLNVRNGKECLIAQDAKGFAREAVRLMMSAHLRRKFGQRAREYVRLHHGQEKNREFLRIYKQVIE